MKRIIIFICILALALSLMALKSRGRIDVAPQRVPVTQPQEFGYPAPVDPDPGEAYPPPAIETPTPDGVIPEWPGRTPPPDYLATYIPEMIGPDAPPP